MVTSGSSKPEAIRGASLLSSTQVEVDAAGASPCGIPKFLFVSHYLPPSRYGQPRVIQRLLQDVSPTNYALASVETYDRATQQTDQDGPWLPGRYLKLHRSAAWSALIRRGPLRRYATLIDAPPAIWSRASQIEKILLAERCSVAIACSGDIADLPATWLACRRTRSKFIPYMFDDYVEQWAFNPTLRKLALAFERRFILAADKIIVPNEFLRREYAARYDIADKLTVINNPWLSEPAAPSGPKAPNRPARIVYTGSIYHVHFDAFRNLCDAMPSLGGSAVLDVYSATTPDILDSHGLQSYRYHGHVGDREASLVQRDADILFLPLAFRSTAQAVIRTSAPGKMGEYLASGRPVLVHAPADTFVAWYCRKHGCAEVVSEEDPRQLASAVNRLLGDEAYRARLCAAAAHRAMVDFSPEVARGQFLQLLSDL